MPSTSSHTLGPLLVRYVPTAYNGPTPFLVESDGGAGLVARAVTEADARLIASAPELLAALDRAMPWLSFIVANNHHLACAMPGDATATIEQARAALAKAKDGQWEVIAWVNPETLPELTALGLVPVESAGPSDAIPAGTDPF